MKLDEKTATEMIRTIESFSSEAFNYKDKAGAALVVKIWVDTFSEYPVEVVWKAVKNAMSACEYGKQNWLAAVNKQVKILTETKGKNDVQLWAELESVLYSVYDASQDLRYTQHWEEANARLNKIYNGLSDDIKLYVVNISTLMEIAAMSDENLQYEKARFLKQMPILKAHAKDLKQSKDFLNALGISSLKELTDRDKNEPKRIGEGN